MNKMSKMRRSNQKVRKWLVENNFKDIQMFPHTRHSKDVHFRNLEFDGIASIGTRLVLFQIKSNKKPTKKVQEQYKKVSRTSGIICLWFNCPDRKEIEIYGKDKI